MLAITHVPSPAMELCELTFVSREPIDYRQALIQYEDYCRMLIECGVQVRTLDVNRACPDCCFVEDTAIVLDELAVLCSMGAVSRRGEPAGIEPELRKYREIRRIELPATLDGGDVTRIGKTLLVGKSARTNGAGIESLASVLRPYGYSVRGIGLRDCLHLKSACTALPDDTLLINPNWIDVDALADFRTVDIPHSEPRAADVLSIADTVCVVASHPHTADLIRKRGFEVKTTDLSEFAKAEGGITCLSLLIP